MTTINSPARAGGALWGALLFATLLAPLDHRAANFATVALEQNQTAAVQGRLVTAAGEAPLPTAVVAAILADGQAGGSLAEQWNAALTAVGGDQPDQSVQVVLTFPESVPVGTLLANWTVAYLPDGQAGPETADHAWLDLAPPVNQAAPRLLPLPPDTRLAALRLSARSPGRGLLEPPIARPLATRLYNATPTAWINAESEYTLYPDMGPPRTYRADSLLAGRGEWRNTGLDKDKRIPRAPISEIHPSWVVLSWPEPVDCRGLLVRGNLEEVILYAYTGPPGINPNLAPEAHWRRLRGERIRHQAGGHRGQVLESWFAFPPSETRGLRLLINRTSEGPVARLEALTAIAALTTTEAPAPAERILAGLPIPYEIATDGLVTMVITDAQGRTIRNLIARHPRTAGPNQERWNLKDANGNMVPPGQYAYKAITNSPLTLRYHTTPYPNIGDNAPDNPPWITGHAGSGQWLADHSTEVAVCTVGDRAYLGAPCAERGIAMIETDLDGRKLWGRHNFIAWTGPQRLAANQQAVFAHAWSTQDDKWPGGADFVWRVDRESRQTTTLLVRPPTADRARGVQGMAVLDNRLLLAVRGNLRWLVNAVSEADVDQANCLPRHRPPREQDRYAPDPRRDFLRLFRITGTPPGQRAGLTYLSSERGPETRQHILLALKQPIELGTLVLPLPPPGDIAIRFSTLKPNLPLPADLNDERLWETVPLPAEASGWSAVPLPPNTVTQALRITFTQGDDDEMTDLLGDALGEGAQQRAWNGSLEGMKLLRRRYRSLSPETTILVNSGTVAADGQWNAQRDRPLLPEDPAIYALSWPQAQPVRGLAIQEIDAKRVEVDIFVGDPEQPVDLDDHTLWRQVAEFQPPRRYYYQPDENNNAEARYMDAYVDFGPDIVTRAVRLRMVEQWTTRAEGRAGLYGVRRDRGGLDLEPNRCHVYGVAPLQHLAGGRPEDPLGSQRLEIYQTDSGQLERELPLANAGALAVGADNQVYALSGQRLLRLDLEQGDHQMVLDSLRNPQALAIDADGRFHVFEADPELRIVRIYAADGSLVGQLGTPGGFQVGPWEPTRFGNVVSMAIDQRGQLWAVEAQHLPKRTTLWSPDGQFRREFFGRTEYCGGGIVDPVDPQTLHYHNLEFELNPETGRTRLRHLTWLGNTPAGEQPVYIDGRKYLVTRERFFRQQVGIVYRYDNGRQRLTAAIGRADKFAPLTAPAFRPLLAGKALANYQFHWSDLDDNGQVDPAEVQLFPATLPYFTNFDRHLGLTAGATAFEVERFLPTGVPIYRRRELEFAGNNAYRLEDGGYFEMGVARGRSADGAGRWNYPTEGTGVHAYYSASPLTPEQVVSEFSIVGHDLAAAGDLGEYLVTSTNSGAWHLWTADGLLASYVLLDQRDPRARRLSMPEHHRGMVVENLTAGQEHFSGSVTQTTDGRVFAVLDTTHVFEIDGMDRFRRFDGLLTVTEEDVRAALEHSLATAAETAYRQARLLPCPPVSQPFRIDGDDSDWEAIPAISQDLPSPFSATLRIARDAANLYLFYTVAHLGPFRNSGEDFRQLFKTGAAVDIMLGSDPNAPADRRRPMAGDQRLLFAMLGDRPVAIHYEAVVPELEDQGGERFATGVWSTTFDRIRQLDDVRLAVQPRQNGYTIEAAVPLQHLGLADAQEGAMFKFDWGVLRADRDGHGVMGRHYWSNQATSILSDVAAEAALEPKLWGHLRFAAAGAQAAGQPPPPEIGTPKTGKDNLLDNLLDELDEEWR